MDMEFVRATVITLAIDLVYGVCALLVGVVTLRLVDKLLLKKIDLEEEVKNGNIAAAIFAAALILFIAVVIGMALNK